MLAFKPQDISRNLTHLAQEDKMEKETCGKNVPEKEEKTDKIRDVHKRIEDLMNSTEIFQRDKKLNEEFWKMIEEIRKLEVEGDKK